MWRDQLDPALEKAREAIHATVDLNKANADQAVQEITAAIASAKIRMLVSFIATLLFTFVGAHYLVQAITRPLRQLNEIVDVMRAGDFSIAGRGPDAA